MNPSVPSFSVPSFLLHFLQKAPPTCFSHTPTHITLPIHTLPLQTTIKISTRDEIDTPSSLLALPPLTQSVAPTIAPTPSASGNTTVAPTPAPTNAPTTAPTLAPTASPTSTPTAAPTKPASGDGSTQSGLTGEQKFGVFLSAVIVFSALGYIGRYYYENYYRRPGAAGVEGGRRPLLTEDWL